MSLISAVAPDECESRGTYPAQSTGHFLSCPIFWLHKYSRFGERFCNDQ